VSWGDRYASTCQGGSQDKRIYNHALGHKPAGSVTLPMGGNQSLYDKKRQMIGLIHWPLTRKALQQKTFLGHCQMKSWYITCCLILAEVITMAMYRTKKLVCVLLESLLYKKLSLKEKESLLMKVAENYPFPAEAEEERAIGYESSWKGVIHLH